MEIPPSGSADTAGDASAKPVQVVYLMPADAERVSQGSDLYAAQLWDDVWSDRWLIAGIGAAFALAGVVLALLLTPWYRADVLFAPAEEKNVLGLSGQLAGLANLAGISVGGGDSAEAIAVLKSRDFTRAFIEDEQLLTILFADQWDETAQQWKGDDPIDWPDLRDAVKYFDENVRSVEESRKNKMVTLSIEWKDAETAAHWANSLADRLNDRMRQRALEEAGENVKYLQGELVRTDVLSLQQSISRLLENELQKLMLARGNKEFAFRVIDRAEVPKRKSRPQRVLIVLLAGMVGGAVGSLVSIVRALRKRARALNEAMAS